MKKKLALASLVGALAVGAVAGWIAYQKSQPVAVRLRDIEEIRLVPIPEGPQAPTFDRRPHGSAQRPMRLIAPFIPIPLPHPVWQGWTCEYGGDLVVELRNGRTITYGPCRRPRSIDRLWKHTIMVLSHGRCRPHCSP